MCFVGIIKHCYCYRGLLFSQQDGLNPTSTNILNEFPLVLSHLFFSFLVLMKKIFCSSSPRMFLFLCNSKCYGLLGENVYCKIMAKKMPGAQGRFYSAAYIKVFDGAMAANSR